MTEFGGGPAFVAPPVPGGGSGTNNHHLLTHLTDFDDHTQYLFLAGRAGGANNPLLSLDADGQITGSGDDAHGLVLRSSPGAGPATGNFLVDLRTPTEIDGDPGNANGFVFLRQNQDLTLGGALLVGFGFGETGNANPVYTVKSGIGGIGGILAMNLGFELRNAPGEAQDFHKLAVVEDDSVLTADGAAVEISSGCTVVGAYPTHREVSGGTLHAPFYYGLDMQGALGRIDAVKGVNFAPRFFAAGDLIGLDYADLSVLTVSGVRATVRSVDPLASLLHTGPATFGDVTHAGLLKIEDGLGTEGRILQETVAAIFGTTQNLALYGTTAAGAVGIQHGVALNGTTSPDYLVNPIFLNTNAVTMAGPIPFLIFANNITINDDPVFTGTNANILGVLFTGTWTIGDDSLGGLKIDYFQFQPTIQNPSGVAKILTEAITVYEGFPTYVSDGAPCTIGNYRHSGNFATFQTTNGGTLAMGVDSTTGCLGYFDQPTIDTGVSANAHIAFWAAGALGQGTITDDIAFSCDTSDTSMIAVTGILASLYSPHARDRAIRHIGAARIGGVTDPETILHLSSNTLGPAPATKRAAITFEIDDTNPADPANGTQVRIYPKGTNLVIQYNDAGTTRYFTLDLTQSLPAATWAQSTTPP